MGIKYEKNTARLFDFVSVEEAEGLLEWLQTQPTRRLDLARCEHLHAAVLQLIMALQPRIAAWPKDPGLAGWLRETLESR